MYSSLMISITHLKMPVVRHQSSSNQSSGILYQTLVTTFFGGATFCFGGNHASDIQHYPAAFAIDDHDPQFSSRLLKWYGLTLHADIINSLIRTQDPYDERQTSPYDTDAISSSLWEIMSLEFHYNPSVAGLSHIFSEAFSKPSYAVEDFLDQSYSTVSLS